MENIQENMRKQACSYVLYKKNYSFTKMSARDTRDSGRNVILTQLR